MKSAFRLIVLCIAALVPLCVHASPQSQSAPVDGEADGAWLAPVVLYQTLVQQTIVIRVPPQSQPTNFNASSQKISGKSPPQPIKWKEKDAPKCMAMRSILAVQVTRKDSIDLITRERQRLRAQLDGRCRGQDFYSGFYMERSIDGRLCEDRDILQTRSGLKCEVDKFRLMVPVATKARK